MKGGSKLFIFAGVALALVAVVLGISSFSGSGKADAKKDTTTKITVVEAVGNIPAHQILTAADVLEKQVVSTEATPDGVTNATAIVGQAYRVPLVPGQRLVQAQLEVPGLRNDIEAGKRAISLPVNEVSAMSGLVQDGDYVDLIFHARINLVRSVPTDENVQAFEDGTYRIGEPIPVQPPDAKKPVHPLTGDPGSNFVIRDDVGDASELEPVAKIMLQDIKVLRVIRPGETFQGNGAATDDPTASGSANSSQKESIGQIILQVTPQQAELVTFIQDAHHQYQLVVRSKDDHETVNTTGITFQILATDTYWSLPHPKSVQVSKSEKIPTIASSDPSKDAKSADGS